MNKIRVLIIDDSAFMRRILTDILERDARIEVVAAARNGRDGLEKMEALEPDVITLDVEMPVMDGLTTLEIIMQKRPTPVVMVSSLTKEGADSTIKALSLGAVDVIQKPSGSISLDMETVQYQVIRKVIAAGGANVTALPTSTKQEKQRTHPRLRAENRRNLIAIGTSTGGPRALQEVLTSLPRELPVPVLIVQHMPKGFTKSLSERLNRLAEITIKEAEDGERLERGTAYIAPGDFHMTVRERGGEWYTVLDQTPALSGHRPSVNRLFSSLSDLAGVTPSVVVMTGMGADGSEGLHKLKQKIRHTYSITQSEATCVVYGMPKAAVKSGLSDEVADLEDISKALILSLQNGRE
ncbi:UNVERIFIED_CONTAM: chemotaxis response regulator protein-glutamate methylesterase [Halobacillus marinus]